MKIVFAGTPVFADTILKALLAQNHDIPLVLTQPDRPAGRGMKLQMSPVKQTALANEIKVLQPHGLRLDGKFAEEAKNAHDVIRNVKADIMIVVAYGLILPKSVLEIPHFGCVNIHASLLPRWRGAAPIQRAIEAGDKETGISIMQMDEGLDTGGVIAMGKIPIAQEDTAATLHDKLAELGAKMILQTLGEIEKGEAKTTPQSEYGVTYAEKIRKEESALDFNLSADELAKRINAFNPFPGASANVNGTTVKLWHAKADMRQHNAKNGEVISANQDGVYIACADGVLCVSELQKAGGKKLNAKEFIKGFPLSGQIFQSEKK